MPGKHFLFGSSYITVGPRSEGMPDQWTRHSMRTEQAWLAAGA